MQANGLTRIFYHNCEEATSFYASASPSLRVPHEAYADDLDTIGLNSSLEGDDEKRTQYDANREVQESGSMQDVEREYLGTSRLNPRLCHMRCLEH